MKVLAGLVTQGSGSIGGMTMSKNKQGYYLRSRTVPSNPKTIAQTAIRSGLSALSAQWSTLTSAQMNAWNLYSKNVTVVLNNGQTRALSGFNWFVGANQLRLLASETIQQDAPDIFTLAGTPMVGGFDYLDASSAILLMSVLDPPSDPDTGDLILLQIGRPKSLGTLYFTGPWLYVDTIDTADSGSFVTVDLSTAGAYLATSNQMQWIRVTRILPDGRYSTPVVYGPIIGGAATNQYALLSYPWTQSVNGTTGATDTNPRSAGTITSVTDLGNGYPGITFGLTTGELAVTVAPLTDPGVYDTYIVLNGGLGESLVPTTITIT